MTTLVAERELAPETLADPRSPAVQLSALLDPGPLRAQPPADDSGGCGRRPGQRRQRRRVSVIGLWHSGGAKLADGIEFIDGVGRMFAAMTQASGQVLQLSVVLGPAPRAAAYGPALTDIVIISEAGGVLWARLTELVAEHNRVSGGVTRALAHAPKAPPQDNGAW